MGNLTEPLPLAGVVLHCPVRCPWFHPAARLTEANFPHQMNLYTYDTEHRLKKTQNKNPLDQRAARVWGVYFGVVVRPQNPEFDMTKHCKEALGEQPNQA